MIFLRFGALSRMILLRTLSGEKKLTQRELDAVYRLENVQYGWEFPAQLLTVVIVFTYAVICPVILPVGLMYFVGALTVYKKQVLYVYSPVYESGGAMFPLAVQRTLFGLVCSQLVFWGYTITRRCYYQPFALFPLPILTIFGMNYLRKTYIIPSERLSLERARQCDRLSSHEQEQRSFRVDHSAASGVGAIRPTPLDTEALDHGMEARRVHFDGSKYRQPVLTEVATEPWTYRRGWPDDAETVAVKEQLRRINRELRDVTERSRHRGSPT